MNLLAFQRHIVTRNLVQVAHQSHPLAKRRHARPLPAEWMAVIPVIAPGSNLSPVPTDCRYRPWIRWQRALTPPR